jgi:O-antigen/teichoic acid export membrane protein
MVIGGEALMRLVYGGKYAGSGIILACLAGANAYRNLRIAPSLAALAKGDSQNQLISNLWRVSSLLPALALVLIHKPIWMRACCGWFGEALGCWASFVRLRRRDGVPLSVSLVPTQWLTLMVASAGVVAWFGAHRWPSLWALVAAMLASLIAGAVLASALPELRHEVRSAWEGFRVGGWREARSRMSGHPPVGKAVAR